MLFFSFLSLDLGRPRVTGTIAHECLVSPVINDSYRAVMRARQQKAALPKRTIKRVNEDVGTLNRMASGISTQAQANKFAAFTVSPHHLYLSNPHQHLVLF